MLDRGGQLAYANKGVVPERQRLPMEHPYVIKNDPFP
jgi:hypothetical protein